MRTSPHIPEIEKVEEYKDRLRERFKQKFTLTRHGIIENRPSYLGNKYHDDLEVIADFFINELDPYVHFVDQIFKREDDIADRLKRKFNGYGGRIGFTLHELLELVDKREEPKRCKRENCHCSCHYGFGGVHNESDCDGGKN